MRLSLVRNEGFGKALPGYKIEFYNLICKQKYLIFMVDLLSQFYRFKKVKFTFTDHNTFIADHLKAIDNEKYEKLPDIDGLCDILLEKIGRLETKILARAASYNFNFAKIITQKDEEKVELKYQALIKELDKDDEILKEAATKTVQNRKKNVTSKKPAPKETLFAKETASTVQALTPEAQEYIIAGQTLNVLKKLDEAIVLYEKIADRYTQPLDEKSIVKPDYFHITAAMVELTECYKRKAIKETPNDFYAPEKLTKANLLTFNEKAYSMRHMLKNVLKLILHPISTTMLNKIDCKILRI